MNIYTIYRVFGRSYHRKRISQFLTLLKVHDSDRIIDVGGLPYYWTSIGLAPHILMVNLEDETWQEGNLKKIKGDGRLLEFADNSFDIAFSNSVIEHVGTYSDQMAFAREISRVARRYWVQTPNRWFFVEPHLLTAFIHYLPCSIRRKLVRYFSLWGLVTKPQQKQIDELLAEIRLLDCQEMHTLFPDAEIHREKFFGMTKSIIAIRA